MTTVSFNRFLAEGEAYRGGDFGESCAARGRRKGEVSTNGMRLTIYTEVCPVGRSASSIAFGTSFGVSACVCQ